MGATIDLERGSDSLQLARFAVRTYGAHSRDHAEAVSDAAMLYARCAAKYDPSHGSKLSSYFLDSYRLWMRSDRSRRQIKAARIVAAKGVGAEADTFDEQLFVIDETIPWRGSVETIPRCDREAIRRQILSVLTERQREIASLYLGVDGSPLRWCEIAVRLAISRQAVNDVRISIMRRLRASSHLFLDYLN